MHSYEWNSMGGEIIPVRYGEGRRWGKREGNVCPIPPPPLVRARGEEGEGSASMLTHGPGERENGGGGVTSQVERGSNTSHSRDISC